MARPQVVTTRVAECHIYGRPPRGFADPSRPDDRRCSPSDCLRAASVGIGRYVAVPSRRWAPAVDTRDVGVTRLPVGRAAGGHRCPVEQRPVRTRGCGAGATCGRDGCTIDAGSNNHRPAPGPRAWARRSGALCHTSRRGGASSPRATGRQPTVPAGCAAAAAGSWPASPRGEERQAQAARAPCHGYRHESENGR